MGSRRDKHFMPATSSRVGVSNEDTHKTAPVAFGFVRVPLAHRRR
jgi:hypothetical protein